ncbi:MAG: TatD DNase family protein, partial [Bermanella sp.]
MIDSHCHIDLEVFDSDRDNVLKHAFDEGIERLLVLGLS